MQSRILKKIDSHGRITLSIMYRGKQLDGEVELISTKDGIKVIPFKGDRDSKCIRKFDFKGRLQIPLTMRTMFKFEKEVEVIRNDDSLLIRVPKGICCFCGNTEDVHKFQEKWICKSCLEKIHSKLLNSTDNE